MDKGFANCFNAHQGRGGLSPFETLFGETRHPKGRREETASFGAWGLDSGGGIAGGMALITYCW